MDDASQTKRYLSPFKCAAYGTGMSGVNFVSLMVVQWAMYYYAPPKGSGEVPLIPIALFSLAVVIGHVVDAAANPVIGFLSDGTRTRWGRRIPFIALGSPVLSLVFILLWFPPVQGTSITNFYYFTVMISLFFLMYAVVGCPYAALMPDIARTSQERMGLAMYGMIFGTFGVVTVMIGSGPLIQKFGYKPTGFLMGCLSLLCFVIVAAFIRERPDARLRDAPKLPFIAALRIMASNRPYLIYLIACSFLKLAFNIFFSTLPYFITVLMGGTKGEVWKYMLGHGAFTGIAFIFVQSVAKRLGKERVFRICLLIISAVMPATVLIGRINHILPAAYTGFIVFSLLGIPFVADYVLRPAIFGDIIDYDEKKSGIRREAIYTGFQGMFDKISISLTFVIIGILFHTFGFSAERPLGIQLIGPAASFFTLIGFFIFLKYPLAENRESGR